MENEKRLIDANRAMEIVRNQGIAHPNAYHLTNYATLILGEAPTVDAVEVVHGWWIKGSNVGCGVYFRCSACGVYQFLYGYLSEDAPTGYKYCPNCGAKMDLEG